MKPTRISARRRDDSPFKPDLDAVTPRPVFIIALHRSGTTFLYQALANVFPVAILTVYHVIHYDRILLHHHQGTAAVAGRELDGMFRGRGMITRGIDDVALSQAMPEEYGWVLRSRAGSFHFKRKTAPLLDEICRKLQFIMPSAEAVLLKNPWDTGHAAELLAYFSDARFIFLQRDPVAIMNSQFRVAKYFGETTDPFVNLLFEGILIGRTSLRLQRVLRKAAGESWHGRITLHHIQRDVTRELGRLEFSWSAVPPRRRLAVDYGDLVSEPEGVLKRAAEFLGLSPRSDSARVEPKPRDPTLLPEVAAAEAAFRRRLREKGIAQRPLDEIRMP